MLLLAQWYVMHEFFVVFYAFIVWKVRDTSVFVAQLAIVCTAPFLPGFPENPFDYTNPAMEFTIQLTLAYIFVDTVFVRA